MSTTFIGRRSSYRLRCADPLASGRLTDIFLAEDVDTGREVAIKNFREYVLRSDSLSDFYNEAHALSTL